MTLDPIIEMYEESVKESDERGFADIFKNATESLFNEIKEKFEEYFRDKYFKDKFTTVTFEDVNYEDGYFIFGYGTNSVINFHIKETPGWLYGIWWDTIKAPESTEQNKAYKSNEIKGEFFAQYERDINKFKPSYSMICNSFHSHIKEEGNIYCDALHAIVRNIHFIMSEPELAFVRSSYDEDFNEKYCSRRKAKHLFRRDARRHNIEVKINAWKTKAELRFITKYIKKVIKPKAFYIRHSEFFSPAYEAILLNEDVYGEKIAEEITGDIGVYYLFAHKGGVRYAEKYKRLRKRFERLGRIFSIWTDDDVSDNCVIENKTHYDKYKSKDDKEIRLTK